MPSLKDEYSAKLAKRGKQSHVYTRFQLLGLEIAQILGDNKHKALYIKLAKEYDADALMKVAKEVAERREVKNKGAYFMAILTKDKAEAIRRKDSQ